MKHESTVIGYRGSLEELANDIGDLKYDALAEFLTLLSNKMKNDALDDSERNRHKLSFHLYNCSQQLDDSAASIREAWKICKPFMKDGII